MTEAEEVLAFIRKKRRVVYDRVRSTQGVGPSVREYWALRKAEQAIVDVLAMPLHKIELKEAQG